MNEEADETALVGPVAGKFCFKKQTDGSVVVGCGGTPCIEATVLAAVGPGSNPASDGLLQRVIPPLSAFCLFLSVLSIKRHKIFFFFFKKHLQKDGSVGKSRVG